MSFLSEILERKQAEVAARREKLPEAELEKRLSPRGEARSLFHALSPPSGPVRVIAEVKRASPSAGAIREGLSPQKLAAEYERAGASAISVLTDGPGFGGSLEDLREVRSVVRAPVLRKDFILERYQLLEAREVGADVVLLIVAALPPERLLLLHREATELGLEVLVEVHDEAELDVALSQKCPLIGINNRNLKTFEVDLAVSERLLPKIGTRARAVVESGIKGPGDVARMQKAGGANFLIGEALVRAQSAEALLRSLLEAR